VVPEDIIVVSSGETAKHELERSLVSLQSVSARLLGLVINKLPRKGPGAMYYGYGYAPDNTAPRSAPKSFPKDARRAPPRPTLMRKCCCFPGDLSSFVARSQAFGRSLGCMAGSNVG